MPSLLASLSYGEVGAKDQYDDPIRALGTLPAVNSDRHLQTLASSKKTREMFDCSLMDHSPDMRIKRKPIPSFHRSNLPSPPSHFQTSPNPKIRIPIFRHIATNSHHYQNARYYDHSRPDRGPHCLGQWHDHRCGHGRRRLYVRRRQLDGATL